MANDDEKYFDSAEWRKELIARLELPIANAQPFAVKQPIPKQIGFLSTTGREKRGLQGFSDYCMRDAEVCAAARPDAQIKFDAKGWQILNQVNKGVNSAIRGVPDDEARDHWGLARRDPDNPKKLIGDCEDHVFTKMAYLRDRYNVPPSAMLPTVVTAPNGEGHAILMVRTDKGDLFLDNLDSKIRDARTLVADGYQLHRRVSAQNMNQWVELNNDGTKVMPTSAAVVPNDLLSDKAIRQPVTVELNGNPPAPPQPNAIKNGYPADPDPLVIRVKPRKDASALPGIGEATKALRDSGAILTEPTVKHGPITKMATENPDASIARS